MTAITTTITERIAEAHQAAQASMRDAVAHAIRAGELLIEAKASMPHGAFSEFCKTLPFSDRTARGYMRLARLDDENRQRVADMSLRTALQSIAHPKETQEMPADAREFFAEGLAETMQYGIPFMPGHEATALDLDLDEIVCVEPSTSADFYYVTCISLRGARGLSRPVRRDFIGLVLKRLGVPLGQLWSVYPLKPLANSRWISVDTDDEARLVEEARLVGVGVCA